MLCSLLMRDIERKPVPLRSKGLTGDLRRLLQPTDSFLIENKGLKRAVLYATASRLGIRIITRPEGDGLRVWRNFDVQVPMTEADIVPDAEVREVEKQAKLAELRAMLEGDQPSDVEHDTKEDWRFTKDKPQHDGQTDRWYRQQILAPEGKQRRTVRVDADDMDAILEVVGGT